MFGYVALMLLFLAGLPKSTRRSNFHTKYLNIARQLKDRAVEGMAMGNLGISFGCLGQIDKAITFTTGHLCISRELWDRDGERTAAGNLHN